MSNLLKGEGFKLLRNRTLLYLLIIETLIAFAVVFISFLDEQGLLERIDGLTVEVEQEVAMTGMYMMLQWLQTPELFINILLLIILGAFFITSEYSNGTIKHLIASGHERWKIYISKTIVYALGSLGLYLYLPLALGLFGTLFFGIGEGPGVAELQEIGWIVLIGIIFFLSFICITMVFVMLANSPGAAVVLFLGFYILSQTASQMFGQKYKIGEFINKFSVYNRFSSLYEVPLTNSLFIELTIISSVTIFISLYLGIFLFNRKDIS